MEPFPPPEALQSISEAVDVTWMSVCPTGLVKVQRTCTHVESQPTVCNSGNVTSCSSMYCPRMGSLCRVRVQVAVDLDEADTEKGDEKVSLQHYQTLRNVTETVPTPFERCQDSVLQIPLGDWTTLRLGEGQCDITEACLEGMKAGDRCEILLTPVETGPGVTDFQSSSGSFPLCATVELQAFTPGKESWEMSPGEKWQWVKSHKERGGLRFRSGDVWGAADSYSRALKLLIPLSSHARQQEKKGEQLEVETQQQTQQPPSGDEFNVIKVELHSNLSLCQLKLKQPELAKANAAKATQLEPSGAKAWYRLGQACQMLNELDEAKLAFRKLLDLQPDMPAALKALKEIASREKETKTQLGQRLSKMFS